MKLISHPNVIRMYEVMASRKKIYIVMELVTGGELFDKIASHGRLKEDDARKYFQQLINAVDYCHSRGVYHRDLQPENLLLDANGALKVSDFGLSALSQQVREDGLLHTTCGTPKYVATEVINNKGYDGAKADLWSCGMILFVLMAGYLPFEDSNLTVLYKKIYKADYSCPVWFSTSAKKLIKKILDPNPNTRITIAEVINNEWFKKGYQPPRFETAEVSLDDINSIFNESGDPAQLVVERNEERPAAMNAFELISASTPNCHFHQTDGNSLGFPWWKEEHFNASSVTGDGFFNKTEFHDFLHPIDSTNSKIISLLCKQELSKGQAGSLLVS